jgi:hypothetical protein
MLGLVKDFIKAVSSEYWVFVYIMSIQQKSLGIQKFVWNWEIFYLHLKSMDCYS